MKIRTLRHPAALAVAAVTIAGAMMSPPRAAAQRAEETVKGAMLENYDVRDTSADRADAAALAATRATYRARSGSASHLARAASAAGDATSARTSLAAAVGSLRTENNAFGTATEIVGTEMAGRFLTAASAAPRESTLRGFLARYAGLYGLTAGEVPALVKTADYANPAGNLAWVRLEQRINGLPVFQGELQAAFTADGALVRTTGNLAQGLDADRLPAAALLTPAQAMAAASANIGHPLRTERLTVLSTEEAGRVAFLAGGPYVRTTRAELLYFQPEPGVTTLAYAMVLWENVRAYSLLVDANDGTLLWRKNITQDQTQTATYNVYTGVSPTPVTPTPALPGSGYQPPEVARVNVTLVADDLNASPLGWLTDGTNTTVGNNVRAGIDVDKVNGIDSNVTGTNRVFSFDYNPAPGLSGAAGSLTPSDANYRNGIVTNLFFWTNRYHDWVYNFGFTEAARNFQTTNTFTINGTSTNRGGNANDPVLAESQDYSGTNNANFSTPGDGSSGRMQMYLFTNTTPNRDGSLDADVFIHEMTHGTSNRLHNNGSGLTITQAAGMGEGWSDFYARCLLSRADEDVNAIYPSGGYVTYQLGTGFTDNYYYGIRRFPYAVKTNVGANGRPHNPLTLGDVDSRLYYLGDGAYPASPIFGYGGPSEVHNIGEVWCMMLLEFRARLINRLGWAVGNPRAVQIVTDAMKLDGTNPTIIQARDSIIAAANAGSGGAADANDARIAFAIRGAGAGAASTGTGSSITVTESYLPDLTLGTLTFTDTLGNNNGAADPGEDIVLSLPLTNPLTTANTATAQIGTYASSYGPIAANGTTTRTFSYRVPASALPGQILTIPVSVTSAIGTYTATVSLRVGTAVSSVLQNFDGVTAPALPPGWTTTTSGTAAVAWVTSSSLAVDSGNAAFGADPGPSSGVTTGGEESLVSPTFALPAGGSQLTFKHRYAFENTTTAYDGGVLEIKIGGGAFTDIIAAGGSFAQGGYTGYIANQGASVNPLSNRPGWVNGSTSTLTTTVVNLPPAAAGQSVQLRWRIGHDNSTAGTGWYVDGIGLTSFAASAIDTDGDGLQDGYELANGLNPNDPNDAALDSDGDGVSNLQEYLAGTDPRSAASALRITQSAYSPTNGLLVSFPTVNGKVYQLEYKDSLTDPAWTTLPGTYTGDGTTFSVVFSPADLGGRPTRFYRVRVTGP